MRWAVPARSDRNLRVSAPVICQSGAVSPSPVPLRGWLDATETMYDIGAGSTRSLAITVTVTSTIWWFGGQRLPGNAVTRAITGGVVSRTVTVNDPCPVLLWVSVAVHCTVVMPSGKVDPEAWSQVTGREPS